MPEESLVESCEIPRKMDVHPGYIWRRVARDIELPELLVLMRLSKSINLFLLHLLYRHIWVGKSAGHLVWALSCNRLLPPVVKTLYFDDDQARVDTAQWAAVLPALSHLWALMITPRIPMPLDVIPRISFRLSMFGSTSSVDHAWTQLIASQDNLQRIMCGSQFHAAPWPQPQQLPILHCVRGRPADLADFAFFNHPLETMWFLAEWPRVSGSLRPHDVHKFSATVVRPRRLRMSAPDFVRLVRASPGVLLQLRHLVLDEDMSWSNFKFESDLTGLAGSSLADVVTLVANRCFPKLESIFLVCSVTTAHRANRILLSCKDAFCFVKFMTGYCYASGSRLRSFRFVAVDGYATCYDWDPEIIN
ncbi:hypothetical protein C8R45DRAFT_1110765 [Mycena sanguinolenta]|nr:hypothetical protein C8R45DRAFT_1110765 [Mycena sanguinolenta]